MKTKCKSNCQNEFFWETIFELWEHQCLSFYCFHYWDLMTNNWHFINWHGKRTRLLFQELWRFAQMFHRYEHKKFFVIVSEQFWCVAYLKLFRNNNKHNLSICTQINSVAKRKIHRKKSMLVNNLHWNTHLSLYLLVTENTKMVIPMYCPSSSPSDLFWKIFQ